MGWIFSRKQNGEPQKIPKLCTYMAALLLRHERKHRMVLFFVAIKEGGVRRARPEPAEAKNHPVNGFSAPRAGAGTAPVPGANPSFSAIYVHNSDVVHVVFFGWKRPLRYELSCQFHYRISESITHGIVAFHICTQVAEMTGISKSTLVRYRKVS